MIHEAYNIAGNTDLGSAMGGYYVERAYNLLPLDSRQKLDIFLRYENFNTHQKTSGTLIPNDAFHRSETTFGISYHLASGAVFKADYQSRDSQLKVLMRSVNSIWASAFSFDVYLLTLKK